MGPIVGAFVGGASAFPEAFPMRLVAEQFDRLCFESRVIVARNRNEGIAFSEGRASGVTNRSNNSKAVA